MEIKLCLGIFERIGFDNKNINFVILVEIT